MGISFFAMPPVNVEIPLSLILSLQLKHIGSVVPKLIMCLYTRNMFYPPHRQGFILSAYVRLSQQGMLKTNVQCMNHDHVRFMTLSLTSCLKLRIKPQSSCRGFPVLAECQKTCLRYSQSVRALALGGQISGRCMLEV